MDLPTWLQENDIGMCPCGCMGARSKKNFVEKTLFELARVVRDSIFSEELAAKQGLLQSLDPRSKLIGFFFLLLAIAIVQNPVLLLLAYAALVLLALLSYVPLGLFVKRVWLVVPLFTGVMLLPALFNWLRPGDPLITLLNFGHVLRVGPWNFPATLAITRQGVKGNLLVMLRVGNSVSLAALLTLTTRWPELLKALRILFVPKIFITTLEMTYRYIFVLLALVEDMFFARKARMLGPGSLQENRHFIAASMGTLFGKSQAMSEEVYASMLARGYSGEIKTMSSFHFKLWDWAAVLLSILLSLLLFVSDKALGGNF
ncbi:MAG: cobalt ECF transporter T component CbiQ [Peptococcaceae bacterium]|nr:cobalt ECF transporter T component CbiQ [Peptococcaceae bacterium]